MPRDYRDDVIEALAASEAALAATCAGLRGVLSAALTRLHEQHVELTRLRDAYHRALNEHREFRARVMREAA